MRIKKQIVRNLTLAGILSLWCARALALDATVDASQYGHTAWKIRDGFSRGIVTAFAQTQDGYFWLGTEAGLTRFDGIRSLPWQPPSGSPLPDSRIRALLAARDGTLWIGTWTGLAHWNGKKLVIHPRFRGSAINALVEDREGTLWVSATSATTALICALQGTKTECEGEDGSLGAGGPMLYQTQDGALWASMFSDLWRRRPGGPKHYSLPESTPGSYQQLSESETGTIVVLTLNGIWQVVKDKVEAFPFSGLRQPIHPTNVLRDRDGAFWIGTLGEGLLHVHQGRVDRFDRSDGLSGDTVARLFEDREGNIWVTTTEGLDRFRALPARTYSTRQGVPALAPAVLADKNGSVWIAVYGRGLYRSWDGRLLVYRAPSERAAPNRPSMPEQPIALEEVVVPGLPERALASLFRDRRGRIWYGGGGRSSGFGYLENDHFTMLKGVHAGYIDSITEDATGTLWIAHRDMGLLRVSADLSVQPVKLNVGVRIGDAWRLAADPVRGGLWLGLFSGGVAHFANGRIDASYSAKDGLGKGAVNDLRVAADGAIWVATNGGLSRIKDGRIATMTGRGGLPCDIVHASVADDAGAIWVYTACGLVRIARRDLDVWAAGLGQGKARPIPTFVLSDIDGVRSYATASTPTPHLTKARDGTLWFKTYDGVTVVDPRHLLINTLPPPVHVEQLVADRTTYDPSSPIRLPPLTRDVQLDYTALSLVAPEKNQFRYRLEGRDRDWQDSSNRRQAFYTDLAPGNYRFRVIASNNSDIWNREGATLAFSVAPAWWQTNWFRVLGAAFLLLMLAAIYKLRMRQLAQIQHRQRELSAELAHANRVATLGQLTASIAHEVSQPLSATIANAHAALRWLKAEPPNAFEAHLALDRIVQEGSRATDIVTRIRGLVKKAPGREGEVYLNDEFRGIIPLTRSEADRHGIELLIELSPDLPVIRGDRVQLQQVLLNLVVNAIEATGNVSSGPRDVVISSEPDGGGGVVVSVRDTGPGLDPEAAARLFEPFYTTKQSGLGMGLSICRSIIEAHGGQLWVTANTPRGAIFQFTLPARRTAGR